MLIVIGSFFRRWRSFLAVLDPELEKSGVDRNNACLSVYESVESSTRSDDTVRK